MLMYSALSTTPFRSIKLRTRRPTCPACGNEGQKVGTINEGMDYVQFCGGERPDWVSRGLVNGSSEARVSAAELKRMLEGENQQEMRIIDVRPRTEFGICALPGSIRTPFSSLFLLLLLRPLQIVEELIAFVDVPLADIVANPANYLSSYSRTVVVCRLGNDSQIAADALRGPGGRVQDLVGGLRAWSQEVDPNFPIY